MKNIFLILGYGIPKDILKDENYNFYLKMVFNKIYAYETESKDANPFIICCGGGSDMFEPYQRNEADEMARFLAAFIKDKPVLEPITKNWQFISEKESLSTLENLINSKKIIQQKKIKKANVIIFCEQIRSKRIKTIAKKIFSQSYRVQVVPIDFDISSNRYLPPDFINKKEKAELKHSLWALQSPKNFKKYHKVFEEKIEYLRKAGPSIHVEAVKRWWEQKLEELEDQ